VQRESVRADVEEFVVARSDRLLRTAYFLTGDAARAEALLRAALAEAWTTWEHGELPPEPSVLAAMARRYLSWWSLGHGYDGPADPLGQALQRLPRRQRVVVVLRHAADLSTTGAAEVLGWAPATVTRLEARVSSGQPELAALLRDHTPTASGADTRRRLTGVRRRARARRARQRAVAVAAVPVVAVTALAVGAALTPPPRPALDVLPKGDSVRATPLLLGSRLPHVVRVWDREYRYVRTEVSQPGTNPFTVLLTPGTTRALAWVSPGEQRGRIVVVVDGHVVRQDRAGMLRSALVLSGRTSHVVSLRATRPRDGMRLGLAVYR